MAEEMNDKIGCDAWFKNGVVTPRYIQWKRRQYQIKKILLRWEERKGKELLNHFSVTDGANIFHIVFSPETLNWRLLGIDKGD